MTTDLEIETEVEELLALQPEASASGHNAYYHYCDAVEHFSPYCACINKVAAHAEKNLSSTFAECATAISGKHCPAVSMRKQELEAGVAMFYISRSKYHYEAQLREVAALKTLAADNEKNEKANKRKTGNHAQVEEVAEVETFEAVKRTVAVKPAAEETFSFESAMAKVLTSEIEKANAAGLVPKDPPQPAVDAVVEDGQVETAVAKKSMVELAREMAAKRKATNA